MSDSRLTPGNFDRGLRDTLRYKHDFSHDDLERAKGIIGDAIEHVEHKTGTSSGISAKHLDMAMHFLEKDHAGWKNLPDHQRAHIETALKEHFGLSEQEAEA